MADLAQDPPEKPATKTQHESSSIRETVDSIFQNMNHEMRVKMLKTEMVKFRLEKSRTQEPSTKAR